MEEETKETINSRRELLKKVGKTAVFVIPTLITFSIPSLTVAASVASMRTHLGNSFRGDTGHGGYPQP